MACCQETSIYTNELSYSSGKWETSTTPPASEERVLLCLGKKAKTANELQSN